MTDVSYIAKQTEILRNIQPPRAAEICWEVSRLENSPHTKVYPWVFKKVSQLGTETTHTLLSVIPIKCVHCQLLRKRSIPKNLSPSYLTLRMLVQIGCVGMLCNLNSRNRQR